MKIIVVINALLVSRDYHIINDRRSFRGVGVVVVVGKCHSASPSKPSTVDSPSHLSLVFFSINPTTKCPCLSLRDLDLPFSSLALPECQQSMHLPNEFAKARVKKKKKNKNY